MRFQKIVIACVLASITMIACNTEEKKTEIKKVQTTPNPKKLALNISGMTCQIGCAKIIQSKLSKKEGITSAKVIFKDSIGFVAYDANTISKEDITTFVNGIAGGELYKVTGTKEVDSFENKIKEPTN